MRSSIKMLCILQLFLCFNVFTRIYALEKNIGSLISNTLKHEDHYEEVNNNDWYSFLEKVETSKSDKVTIQLYYESLCPYCKDFYTLSLAPVVQKLGQYLTVQTFPYGNAKTTEHDGKYEFKCQHGPYECYGNKLHACALDFLKDTTKAVMFNACLMTPFDGSRTSDDEAADKCGKEQNVDSAPIKECAKGDKGDQLMKHYSDESKKANFKYVPYVMINGVLNDGDQFMKVVCAAFTNPPPPCSKVINLQ